MKIPVCGSCRRPRPSVLGELRRQQRLRPLAPGLWRRPDSAAYGPGSSVFTIRAKKVGHGSRLGFPGRRPPRDPTTSANVARALQVLLPGEDHPAGRICSPVRGWRHVNLRPTGGGGRAPSRPEENFATAICFLMEWCVKSLRTDGQADDRTRWQKRRRGRRREAPILIGALSCVEE